MSDIVFDLTEVFSASTGKLRFYGIMRVVQEIGIELVRQNAPVRYGIYSYAHQGFLEVHPILHSDGSVDLNVPLGIREMRIRPIYARRSQLSQIGTILTRPFLKALNGHAWRRANVTRPMLDMTGKTLVSAARPKLIVAAMDALERRGQKAELVPLLHDMIPLHPQFGHKSAFFAGKFLDDNCYLIERARLILANSEFTKSEITTFCENGTLPPAPPIATLPLVHECAPGKGAATVSLPKDPYILTVGATIGRKNLDASLRAMLHLKSQGVESPCLVVAGTKRQTTERYLQSDDMAPIRDKVIFVPTPEQSDLVALYKGAVAVVMASRMEGWGLPAGEALWHGVPAICSTAPVLEEVCGDLGLYFDPDSPEELAAHIQRLMEDSEFAAHLRRRIRDAHPTLRTWARVAQDLQQILQPA